MGIDDQTWDKLYTASVAVAYSSVGYLVPDDHPARNTILHEIADDFRSAFIAVVEEQKE